MRALDKFGRLLGTGFCFAVFGVGGVLMWLFLFPLLFLVVREPESRARTSRLVVHWAFKTFWQLMKGVRVLDYRIHGVEKLNRSGLLILPNHPTLIDVILLISVVKNLDCVVKASLAENPFTGASVRSAGYVRNNTGPELIASCVESVAKGNNLVIFPEGTRTVPGRLPQLQRGAANVAVRGGFNITPVIIRVDPPTLSKGEKWYKIPPRRVQFHIEVLDDIQIEQFRSGGVSDAVAARRVTGYLTDFYTRKLGLEDASRGNQETDHRHAVPRGSQT
jgi:1-acyl-sn-glycerol-3-phosphate acyltransferase